MIINAHSLHDLAGFVITASLSVVFYVVYGSMGRRHLYLLFANLIALAACACLFTFLVDNSVPAGIPLREIPETEATFLHRLRWLYLIATLYLPVLCHFVVRYCRDERVRTHHVVWVYGVSLPLGISVWSSGFFSPRGEALCEIASWACTVPWWPHMGPAFHTYVAVWAAVNVWAQVELWRYARLCGSPQGTPLARVRLVQWGILIPAGGALVEMVAVAFGYAGIAFFPITASIMGVLIASALALDGMDQHRLSRALKQANQALQREVVERERVERERARLDVQLGHLRYLYRLRSAIASAQTREEAVAAAGKAVAEVLAGPPTGGALLELEGRQWRFGRTDPAGQSPYDRTLTWGSRARGRLSVFSPVALTEAQERALVDETAGQISHALEARELELQLTQSARLVSLGQLAAGVAHELSQPLSALGITVGDLWLRLRDGMGVSEKRLKEMAQDLRHLVARMGDTVEHLRVFSRDASREPDLAFCVNAPLLSGLKLVRAQLENHGIALDIELTEPLPLVSGHPHRLEQVFLNLLTNARDSLDEKSAWNEGNGGGENPWRPRVSIRTQQEVDGGRWVVALVEDNGTGIDEACLQRVFDPFFTTKPADRGTGLGLSISYAIVKDHGGHITGESRVGEGARFRIALPAAKGG